MFYKAGPFTYQTSYPCPSQ